MWTGDEWIPIPSEDNEINISDSIVMGDVIINQSSSNQSVLICPFCGAGNVEIIPCSVCKKLCCCKRCENGEYAETKTEEILGYMSGAIFEAEGKTKCVDCIITELKELCNETCEHCKVKFQYPDPALEHAYEYQFVNTKKKIGVADWKDRSRLTKFNHKMCYICNDSLVGIGEYSGDSDFPEEAEHFKREFTERKNKFLTKHY